MDEADESIHELHALWAQLPRTEGLERAELLEQLGGVLHQRGQNQGALEAVEAARALYADGTSGADVARCDHNAAVILVELARADEALARYHRAARAYRADLRLGEAALSLRSAAELEAEDGCSETALQSLLTAAALHDDGGEPVRAALARLEAGGMLLELDRDQEAAEVLAVARAVLRADGALLWVARADQLLAEVARRLGRWSEAFERVDAARAVFDAADMDADRDRCDDLWCAVLVDSGRPDEAVARLQQARETRRDEGDPVGVAWCDFHLSRALERLGVPDVAAVHRRRARAVFDAAGLDAVLRRRELAPS